MKTFVTEPREHEDSANKVKVKIAELFSGRRAKHYIWPSDWQLGYVLMDNYIPGVRAHSLHLQYYNRLWHACLVHRIASARMVSHGRCVRILEQES